MSRTLLQLCIGLGMTVLCRWMFLTLSNMKGFKSFEIQRHALKGNIMELCAAVWICLAIWCAANKIADTIRGVK